MTMHRTAWFAFLLLLAGPAWGRPHIQGIKLAVENPSAEARPAANVVVRIDALRKIAPDFTPGSFLVTATDAATLDQDASTLQAAELASQVDDLDGDGRGDELAFQMDLAPHQTRIVTISFGDEDRIWRLRSEYPQRTAALFSGKIEGLGWESERNAWRIYFDPRNAIDLYGKRRPTLQLKLFASPDYIYHDESPEGRDIYKVGDALGIGAAGALVDGKLVKIASVKDRKWRILAAGPVRTIVELDYDGWSVGGKSLFLRSRITQWAGERGFYHSITVDGAEALAFVTGLPLKPGVAVVTSAARENSLVAWLVTYGEQVVATGPTATEAIPGQNLGLAILTATPGAGFADDAANHFVTLKLKNGTAEWYAMAAWDQEGTNRRVGYGNSAEMRDAASAVLPPDGITTKEAFLTSVKERAERMAAPVKDRMLTPDAAPQPAPPDTAAPHRAKTFSEAISLIRQFMDRTATQWEPVIRATARGGVSANQGEGFFAEADNHTGEWKRQNGFSWTGSFWTGALWQMYARTHEEKYRRWAELWGARLTGQEMQQNHDVGFLYYYSAALGYDWTRQEALRESALRAAERLAQLYNPRTRLIAAWGVDGDDTIIDTMMNLQILWWASKQTGDAKWREIGWQHALRSAEWLIRPDGSVAQSVHYNPGEAPREFVFRGGTAGDRENALRVQAAPGEWAFQHTHQGFAADTAWSRGTAWGLYGFVAAYRETKDARLRAAAERIADYALENLPDDGVPWYDFYDEGVRFRNRDSSSAALLAGGLLRLAELADSAERKQRYRREGKRIVQSLVDRYLTPVGPQDQTPPGVLRHGSSTRPNDAMLIYGQYYLLEDLLLLEPAATR